MKAEKILIFLIVTFLVLSGCYARETTLHQASQLEKDGKIMESISMYEKHIHEREKSDREEWENPQFYRLIIADLKASLNDIDGALHEIKSADDAHVDPQLILDRVRKIAIKIAENGDTHRAIELLDNYRTINEVLVDATIDRIARKFILIQE